MSYYFSVKWLEQGETYFVQKLFEKKKTIGFFLPKVNACQIKKLPLFCNTKNIKVLYQTLVFLFGSILFYRNKILIGAGVVIAMEELENVLIN